MTVAAIWFTIVIALWAVETAIEIAQEIHS